MKGSGLVAGVILSLVGVVWTLQGLGSRFAPQSFMTSNRTWIWIGLATIAAGVHVARRSWRRR